MSRLDTVRHVAAACFVVTTGLFPVTSAFVHEADDRTDFTWDMFAIRRDCSACLYHYEVGDQRQRISWGYRGAPDVLDSYGRGALLVHPSGPAVNVRSPVQVARLRHGRRLEWLGAEMCTELRGVFDEVIEGSYDKDVWPWIRAQARRYRASGGRIGVYAQCDCRFNDEPMRPLVDPTQNLCPEAP